MQDDHAYADLPAGHDSTITRYGERDYVDGWASDLSEEPIAAQSAAQGIGFVTDGSVSMDDPIVEADAIPGLPPRKKKDAATVAVGDTVSRLLAARNSRNFSVGYVAFNNGVSVDRPIRPIHDLPATEDYDPTQAGTGGTCIYAGLEASHQQIVAWRSQQSGSLAVSNVVLVLGDGLCSDPARTLAAAQRLKELPDVTIAACLLTGRGEPAQGAQLLQHIASAPRFYKTVFGGDQIREFFLASVTIAQGGKAL